MDYDVIVAGASFAGLAAANALEIDLGILKDASAG